MSLLHAPEPEARVRGGLSVRLRPAVLDPVVVGLVALVVYAMHGFDAPLSRDLGIFVYGGEQVTRGVPPYVGIFNTVGPLADAIPGLAIGVGNLGGLDPVLSARLFFLLLSAVCCALVSVLARDTFGSRTTALLAPALFLTFQGFIELASSGPREKTTMVVFLLVSLILVGRQRWLGAGVCAALATLTWQPALVVAVAAVAVAAVTAGRCRARALLRFVLGGGLTTLVTVVYFVLVGAARQALDGFLLVNARYTSQPSIFDTVTLQHVWHDYHVSLLVVVLGLAALLLLAGRAAPYAMLADDAAPTTAWRLTAMGAGGLAGTVWTVCVINGGPDLFVVLPLAALGAAGGSAFLLHRWPGGAALSVVAVVVAACVVIAGVEALSTRKDTLVRQRADARAVLATQPDDATILSIDAPQALAVVDRRSIWPYQLFGGRMDRFLDASQPNGVAGPGRRLALEHPTFVLVSGYGAQETWDLTTLEDGYHRVGHGPGWVWYLTDDADPAALAAARAANKAAMGR